MRRVLLYLFALPMLAAASVASFASRAAGAIADAVAMLFTADPPRLFAAGPGLALNIGGTAVAADVQQALRHEAGVSRRSAARHT